MNDDQLLRYSRHILLPEVGIEGQQRLLASRALLIGAGGLGSPIALYLASGGVGHITICDGDKVDLTNLQRQIVHRTDSIGTYKALSAQATLASINPEVEVVAVTERAGEDRIAELVADADVVLDGSDNFATRNAVNRACVLHRKPLVSGAAVRFDGQVAVFDMRRDDAPCYACLFPDAGENEDTPCAIMGVFAPVTGIIGTIQAAEALKLLAGAGEVLAGRLLLVDALTMQLRTIRLSKDPACAVCAKAPEGMSASARG
ncbi:MAG: adenylyltransferase [Betaproteobacteria bacterium]|jgi:molybdopterin/thiamine biosynthesis adenylyltransferase|nr:adenylyltransferase [Betaproteobacteria bacterium]MEA3157085.1 molybdopterin-synthase adenylyltransferase [Betaproteobacteria bacterium]